ncbi:hypothetical protein NIES4071_83800 [Calothrix sp. NIES-4071]|nr:hypothetical protein NIES4071_83800 [Calothrix sp. NIES-4071]BAZ62648.1 hypothetical protein NIES4105_83730 [Calothrix sp. NIES-4105]
MAEDKGYTLATGESGAYRLQIRLGNPPAVYRVFNATSRIKRRNACS